MKLFSNFVVDSCLPMLTVHDPKWISGELWGLKSRCACASRTFTLCGSQLYTGMLSYYTYLTSFFLLKL